MLNRQFISMPQANPQHQRFHQHLKFGWQALKNTCVTVLFSIWFFKPYRFEKLTTVANILLLNLVVSSLIFVSSLPFMGVYNQLTNWIFGSVMCKVVGCFYFLGLYSSVLFLTLLTFDRYLAVVHSLSTIQMRNRKYAVISCTVVWLVSGIACIKQMIHYRAFVHRVDNKTYCDEYPLPSPNSELLRTSGFYIQIFLFLLFPLTVFIYCYVRITITVISSKIATKFKTVRLIFIIVLLFFVCWTPFNIVQLLEDKVSEDEKKQWRRALYTTRQFAYLYFCISPVLYTFVGRKFQNYARQIAVKRFPHLKKYISVELSGTRASTRSTQNDLLDVKDWCVSWLPLSNIPLVKK